MPSYSIPNSVIETLTKPIICTKRVKGTHLRFQQIDTRLKVTFDQTEHLDPSPKQETSNIGNRLGSVWRGFPCNQTRARHCPGPARFSVSKPQSQNSSNSPKSIFKPQNRENRCPKLFPSISKHQSNNLPIEIHI